METDWTTFSRSGSVATLGNRPSHESRLGEHARYVSPQHVFEQDYERLVQALAIVAGDKETAADAVQEAFVRLVRGWDYLSSYEDPAGWVRRVALNQILDHHRSVWRQARLLSRIQQQYQASHSTASMDERLWERLTALPLKQRTALALYYMEHLTSREVAEIMHVSEGTVKQHLHRARQTLKVTMKEARDD